jgi:hypothetical protein
METLPTGNTVLLPNRFHLRGKTMFHHLERISSWNIDAGLDTTKAHHASINPLPNQGGSIFNGGMFHFFGDELLMVDSKFIGAVLELAFPSGIAYRTV